MVAGPSQREQHRQWTVEDVTVTEPPVIKRAIAAAAIGNITEWYDFGVYGYLSLTMKTVFFPETDGVLGSILVAGLFAVAFLVRPLGGMFFGPLSDRIGRNRVLALTMLLMAAGTFLIGCLPDYHSIGLWAAFLLLLCRLLQGFSTGGEYGNAMTFIAEYAPDRRRGLLGSMLEVGTFTGYLLGASLATIMSGVLSPEAMLAWGWRVPFYVALPLGVVGLYLRSKLDDPPAFEAMEKKSAAKEEHRVGAQLKQTFRLWPNMLVCCGLVIAWNVANYMLTAYMPSYIPIMASMQGGRGAVSELTSQILQIIVMAVCLALIPVLGWLSDRVGRRAVALTGSAALILLAVPALLLIRADGTLSTLFGLLIMGLSLICFSATMPSTLPSLFPTALRAGALSIAFNISISLFGGTTSVVMETLVGKTQNLMWPAYYLMITGVIGFISLRFTPESNGRPLWGSTPAVARPEDAPAHVEELNARVRAAEATRQEAPTAR
ncbi:MFS transporter [Rothia kristinae]|uniref:Putative proline/betaine transporter n=1 Tax=Rothia kristinae TaxID=37923 RepID=A0A1S2N0D4_9MICC|nr:MFS transporter [Rothia kristinae]OIJ36102.1 MFS transporter [Rothia kristinae]